jgi:hypothetical protein
MKHASESALLLMTPLLDQLRSLPGLKEKKLGIFYRKSRAFLHFHEEGEQLFADVRLEGEDFERFEVTTQVQQMIFLEVVKTFFAT